MEPVRQQSVLRTGRQAGAVGTGQAEDECACEGMCGAVCTGTGVLAATLAVAVAVRNAAGT